MERIKKFKACAICFFMNVHLFGESGLSQRAEPLLEQTGLLSYFTNSLLTSLFVSLSIAFLIRWLTRKGVHTIPNAGQACIEHFIEGVGGILEPIAGKHLFSKVFPLLLGYFIFILIQNLSGLFPGVGSIGLKKGEHLLGIFRPMNADLNGTLALAIIATVAWVYFCLKCVGVRGLYGHVFGNKADKKEIHLIVYSLLFFVFFGVGFVECLSILFRVVSLSFRLYGNVFGGENLLHNMYEMSEFLVSGGLASTDFYAMLAAFSSKSAMALNWMASKLGYLLPLPFYFLEFLVSIVQAFVFTLLVAVYMGLICNHGEEEIVTKV
ncbi:MAG: F0F1 ATP synthase subunit A [Puniceicoccales bacterium]|jgi:F-type H+-transporting ATPase subunit a|nr:F0F1 ATP synthase subunit A [Puniceicoccales bacterium]